MTVSALELVHSNDEHSLLLTDNEDIFANERWGKTRPSLTVLIPVYKYDSSALIQGLSACKSSEDVGLIAYDDGSDDAHLTKQIVNEIDRFKGPACVVTAAKNVGRSMVRNRLETLAKTDWLLYLDGDMLPDDEKFLDRYLKVLNGLVEPTVIVGGLSLKFAVKTKENDLHWRQTELSEVVPADIRSKEPGRYVFTSNLLIHKKISTEQAFDDAFSGWGWEDVEWGLRVAKHYPVLHLDNPATHLGLNSSKELIQKYAQAGRNFWIAVERHPEGLKDTALYRLSVMLSDLPGLSVLRRAAHAVSNAPAYLVPLSLRVFALKLFRACVSAGARHDRS